MMKRINIVPRWIIFMIDIMLCNFCMVAAYLIGYNLNTDLISIRELYSNLLVLVVVNSLVFLNFRSYAGIVRYTGVQDAVRVSLALLVSVIVLALLSVVTVVNGTTFIALPVATLIIYSLFSFLGLISYRVVVKYGFTYIRNFKLEPKSVVIYGAGEAGLATKRVLEHDPASRVKVVAYIDDNPRKTGKVIDGVNIIDYKDLDGLFRSQQIDELVISTFSIPPSRKAELVDICLEYSIAVLTVPPLEKWINGQFTKKQLQSIRIEQLLERDPIQLNHTELNTQLKGKRILVTGGAGSIGSEIVRQLLRFQPGTIVVCDQAETPLHDLELELSGINSGVKLIFFLGDVRNPNRMQELFEEFRPQIVYHAAAYKHVPMMEQSPAEAVLTNVGGTKLIADLSVRYHAQRFVMVSTDKAVNPTNVMGASKRLAEIYVQQLAGLSTHQTKFITTRFGNVLGSNGSVILRFRDQIAKGGPVTVTHPNIIRYFMTIPEATQLVLEAGSMGNGGEIYVFDMGKPVPIVDLARKMIRLSGLVPGIDIEIKYTGLRPGEKLYEELLNDAENTLPTHHQKILIAKTGTEAIPALEQVYQELFVLAADASRHLEMVGKMKVLVPEFISNNSVFEQLDQQRSKLVSINKIG
ncbi:MAG: polysaccharide biosynthesis protein [Sphingomonadales bacterium]|nr:polysaccharide biosynthesis protein [Sphingomonadales bacterium]